MPKRYDRLVQHVRESYIKRGYPPDEAERIGYATATKVLGKPSKAEKEAAKHESK